MKCLHVWPSELHDLWSCWLWQLSLWSQVHQCACVLPLHPDPFAWPAGQLGEVLEESARIALSWVRAHAVPLGLPGGSSCPSRTWDVHIHLPAGEQAGLTLSPAWCWQHAAVRCWLYGQGSLLRLPVAVVPVAGLGHLYSVLCCLLPCPL